MRLVAAQLKFRAGDCQANAKVIIEALQQARECLKADVIVFPELAVSGYLAEDCFLSREFKHEVHHALQTIIAQVVGITVILGFPEATDVGLFNAACVIQNQTIQAIYRKQHLPNTGVFDEKRYFTPGHESCVISIGDKRFGLLICEDIWTPEPIEAARVAGAECIIVLNASPFEYKKAHQRNAILSQRVQETALPILYVNTVGGQSDLVFDGGSLFIAADGVIQQQAPWMEEHLMVLDFIRNGAFCPISSSNPCLRGSRPSRSLRFSSSRRIDLEQNAGFESSLLDMPSTSAYSQVSLPSEEVQVWQALVLAVRDYASQNGFTQAILGLSGGIDSSVVLAIAVDALGKENVHAILLPSRYTSELSTHLALEMCHALGGVKHTTISIEPNFQACLRSLELDLNSPPEGKTIENLQARCRGILLMAMANQTGALLLNTTNKSELAVGYGTLYGDLIGGFAPLKDVFKTRVYQLAEYRNQFYPIFSEQLLKRPPTAELKWNQCDQDSLPPYSELDLILAAYTEQNKSVEEIIQLYPSTSEYVRQVITWVAQSEFKRRQAPIGPCLSGCGFGRGRRYPL